MSASGARGRITASNRGPLGTSGFYGRRATSGSELKFLDTTLAPTTAAAAGTVTTNLVAIPQNDTESGRVGRRVVIRSIHLRGNVRIDSTGTAAAGADQCRLILVQDKQANGAAFAVTDVLASADYRSHKNLDNVSRFRILMDKQISLNATASFSAATVEHQYTLNQYMKCYIPMDYDASAATGAITTQKSNSVALLMISENANAIVSYIARVRYSDN